MSRHLQYGIGGCHLLGELGHPRHQGVITRVVLHPAGRCWFLILYELHHSGSSSTSHLWSHSLLHGLQLHTLLCRHSHQDEPHRQDF